MMEGFTLSRIEILYDHSCDQLLEMSEIEKNTIRQTQLNSIYGKKCNHAPINHLPSISTATGKFFVFENPSFLSTTTSQFTKLMQKTGLQEQKCDFITKKAISTLLEMNRYTESFKSLSMFNITPATSEITELQKVFTPDTFQRYKDLHRFVHKTLLGEAEKLECHLPSASVLFEIALQNQPLKK